MFTPYTFFLTSVGEDLGVFPLVASCAVVMKRREEKKRAKYMLSMMREKEREKNESVSGEKKGSLKNQEPREGLYTRST